MALSDKAAKGADNLQRAQAVWAAVKAAWEWMPPSVRTLISGAIWGAVVSIGAWVIGVWKELDAPSLYLLVVATFTLGCVAYAALRTGRSSPPYTAPQPTEPILDHHDAGDWQPGSTHAEMLQSDEIKKADVALAWMARANGLDVTATSSRPEMIDEFRLFVSDMRIRTADGAFAQVEELHKEGFEELRLDGPDKVFYQPPANFEFLTVAPNNALRYSGEKFKVGPIHRWLTIGGVWEVTFNYKSHYQGRKSEKLRFEWTPGSAPRPWVPNKFVSKAPAPPKNRV